MSSSDSEFDAAPPPKRERKQAPHKKKQSFDDAEFLDDTKWSRGEGVQVDGEAEEKKKIVYGMRRTDGTGLVGPAGSVSWHKQMEKYQALACDRVSGKQPFAGSHETKEAALAALRAKQAPLDEAYEATEVFQAALKATEGLEPTPDKIEEAEFGKTYRHQDIKNKFLPYGAVVVRCGKQGLKWHPACAHVDPATGATWTCGKKAQQAQNGEKPNRCKLHGGGVRCKGAILFTTGEHVPCGYNVSVKTGKRGKYDGRCVRCFCQTEDPNDERVKNAKAYMHAREQVVMELLEKIFPKPEYHWTFDKSYGTRFAFGKRDACVRPDARTVKHGRILIVEVDERSHVSYDCGKEREREEIFKKHAGPRLSLVMLRFNPDEYTDLATGLRVPSCFHHNKESNTVVPNPAQKKQWDLRIEALCARIRVFLDRKDPAYMEEVPEPPPGRCIYMEELFYQDVSGVTDAGKAKIIDALKRASQKRKQSEAAASSKEEAPPPQPRRRVPAPVDSDSDSNA